MDELIPPTTTPPPSPSPLSYATPRPASTPPDFLQPRIIVIDVAIVFGLTFFAGFVAGLLSTTIVASPATLVLGAVASNLVFGTIGFILSGLRAPRGNRWPHLLWVALGVWLTGLLNVMLFGLPIAAWILSGALVAAMTGIGGAISMTIRK